MAQTVTRILSEGLERFALESSSISLYSLRQSSHSVTSASGTVPPSSEWQLSRTFPPHCSSAFGSQHGSQAIAPPVLFWDKCIECIRKPLQIICICVSATNSPSDGDLRINLLFSLGSLACIAHPYAQSNWHFPSDLFVNLAQHLDLTHCHFEAHKVQLVYTFVYIFVYIFFKNQKKNGLQI